jgi:type I restriction enzyme M protein
MAKTTSKKQNGGANLGFEATLWSAADKLRVIFLKYISNAFEEQHAKLAKEEGAQIT